MKRLAKLKVGITVLIGLVIFSFFVIIVGTQENTFASTYDLKMFVTDVDGLAKGSMVTLGGLKIGFVTDMEFSLNEGRKGIIVTLTVEKKYRSLILQNSEASVQTIGLLGDKYVNITVGKDGQNSLNDGDFISVKPSFDLGATAEEIKNTLKDFSSTLTDVKGVIDTIKQGKGSLGRLIMQDELYNELSTSFRSLNQVVSAVQQRKGTLGKMIYDPDLYSQITETAGDLKQVGDSLKYGKGSLGKLVMEDSLYDSFHTMSERMNNILAKTEDKSTSVGGLLNDGDLYKQTKDLMKELKLLISDIKKNPDKYFKFSVF